MDNKVLYASVLLALALGLSRPVHSETEGSEETPTTRLAIVMGGAVSLGAFEAGAIAETISILGYHNQQNPDHRYVIDVLAGASAGSLTLALLARELYYSPGNIDWQHYADSSSIFYRAWVKDVDIKELLPETRHDIEADPYLLSRDAVELIVGRYLTGGADGQPLSMAPDSLFVVMTLADLHGTKQTIVFENHSEEIYLYDDQRYFLLRDGGNEVHVLDDAFRPVKQVDWPEIKNTAIASGAFPFAFAPKELTRYRGEKRDTSFSSHYVDGGFFNNEPLNLAKELAGIVDRSARVAQYDRFAKSSHDRKFIFLAPTDKDTSSRTLEPLGQLTGHLLHLGRMAFTTARSLDYRLYLSSERENKRSVLRLLNEVQALQEQPGRSKDLLRAIQVFSNFGTQSGDLKLLNTFVENYPHVIDTVRVRYAPDLDNVLSGLLYHRDPDMLDLNRWIQHADSSLRQLYVDLFHLRDLVRPNRYILISNDPETKLAGRKYAHFGGFFNESLRRYDYELGRKFARRRLHEHLDLMGPSSPEATQRTAMVLPENLRDHVPSEQARSLLRKRIDERLVGYMSHLKVPSAARSPVLEVIDNRLDRSFYRTPKALYFSWHVNSDRPRSFNLGFQLNPWNLFRDSFYQPRGLGWLWWFVSSETHFVLDAGLTDFWLDSFPWIDPYYYNFGLRLRLYVPGTYEFIKLQPEWGLNLATERLKTDLQFDNSVGSYFALTLRAVIVDVKFLLFFDRFYREAADWRVNFGLSFAVFDHMLRGRL